MASTVGAEPHKKSTPPLRVDFGVSEDKMSEYSQIVDNLKLENVILILEIISVVAQRQDVRKIARHFVHKQYVEKVDITKLFYENPKLKGFVGYVIVSFNKQKEISQSLMTWRVILFLLSNVFLKGNDGTLTVDEPITPMESSVANFLQYILVPRKAQKIRIIENLIKTTTRAKKFLDTDRSNEFNLKNLQQNYPELRWLASMSKRTITNEEIAAANQYIARQEAGYLQQSTQEKTFLDLNNFLDWAESAKIFVLDVEILKKIYESKIATDDIQILALADISKEDSKSKEAQLAQKFVFELPEIPLDEKIAAKVANDQELETELIVNNVNFDQNRAELFYQFLFPSAKLVTLVMLLCSAIIPNSYKFQTGAGKKTTKLLFNSFLKNQGSRVNAVRATAEFLIGSKPKTNDPSTTMQKIIKVSQVVAIIVTSLKVISTFFAGLVQIFGPKVARLIFEIKSQVHFEKPFEYLQFLKLQVETTETSLNKD